MWSRLGTPKHYIEPFVGSAAMLLASPQIAPLEVIGDANGFIANFWRAVSRQPQEVAHWADYPVSHVDLGARHVWLMDQRAMLAERLQDPNWPGDPKVAGWWCWGVCAWIGSGWCDWNKAPPKGAAPNGQIPHIGDAGRGVQARGKIPLVGNAGRGIQARGQIPHVADAGQGIQAIGQIPLVGNAGRGIQARGQVPLLTNAGMGIQAVGAAERAEESDGFLTSSGRVALVWMARLAARLERVRIIHGSWSRTLNHHYGAEKTAVFLDPPYKGFGSLYGADTIVSDVEKWARENQHLRIALCGHQGDYNLEGWDVVPWSRERLTFGSSKTTDQECIWFSPGCVPAANDDDEPELPLPPEPADAS